VEQAVSAALNGWETFYVIMGSSAAALTGLQFVVVTLIAGSRTKSGLSEIDAFGTPTVVHFCAVLLVSGILTAPWRTLSNVGLALSACGVAGVLYVLIVIRRARRQTGYKPVLEDWLWHAVFPFVGYAGLLVPASTLTRHPESSLFGIGSVALVLLFIGIHNAWDTVTYLAVKSKEADQS
jgi:hypothetical protein